MEWIGSLVHENNEIENSLPGSKKVGGGVGVGGAVRKNRPQNSLSRGIVENTSTIGTLILIA